MSPRRLFALLLLPLCSAAFAAAAPWFIWQSLTDPEGARVCAQYSPGPGWQKASGPYRNAACRH